ncbi:MAG TPA: efflux RND transporter permease subunit [Patescibacteria group bacterium]|nr:efflux RND transporter permease subunit [Patescibacteria group bacterium]
MAKFSSYLQKLTFEPKLMGSLFAKYLRNIRLVLLFLILTIAIGVVSYTNIPRVLNPTINIPIVSVSTVLPGASPTDIESLVTIPIEDSLSGIEGLSTMTSVSRDSVSSITLEFETGVDPDRAKNDVQSAVDTVSNLPEDAETPRVQKFDFTNEPVWTFTLSNTHNDTLSLVRFGEKLRDSLEDLPTIETVSATGLDNEEIQILLDPEKLATYGLNTQTVSQAVQAALSSFPAGVIATDMSTFVLSIDPTVTTVDDIRAIRITTQGTSVALSEIATIQEAVAPAVASSYYADRKTAPIKTISFSLYKSKSADLTDAVADAKRVSEELLKPHQSDFLLSSVIDNGEQVDRQFFDLVRDFILIVTLVFIILFLFLGVRQALVASSAIPLTFLITFIVMDQTGIPLSFIAFFSLLLSLGLLVDDTIVVISAITAYYRTGRFTPLEAALLVWRDFRTAILTTTLTTVWAFVPLLLATGIIGEFIKAIPIVVSSTLLASFIVAIFITMPMIVIFLKGDLPRRVVILLRVFGILGVIGLFMAIAPKGVWFVPALLLFIATMFVFFQVKSFLFKRDEKHDSGRENARLSYYINHGIIKFERIERKYRSIISRILAKSEYRRKTIFAIVTLLIFSFVLLPLGFVRNEFFPKSDQEYLFVSLEMPSGTALAITEEEALWMLDKVRYVDDVEFATAATRLGFSAETGGFAGGTDNVALISIVLPPEHDRDRSSIDIAEELRLQFAKYQKGTISVTEVTGGPPAGSDLQIKLSGDDLQVLDTYANKIQEYLKQQPGVINIEKSIKPGTSKIVFVPDYQSMLDADVSVQQVGGAIRAFATGVTVDESVQVVEGSEKSQEVVIRTSSGLQLSKGLQTMSVPTQDGAIPITSLGSFVLRPNPTQITREEGKRTLSVSASVTQGKSISETNAELEVFADNKLELPEGYSWSTGGVNEENTNSVNSILLAMVLSFFLIIVTMVLQFSSFRKAFIVMLVIPLSISGVFIIFALTNTPLSFPALIGVLALFGIVVKNAILVVDKINQNLKQNMPLTEAIVDGSASRLEPIALTSFATIVGLIPITLSNPLWQGLGGAIMAGLFFSGSIMLFFIPVVYYVMFHKDSS